MSKINEEFKYPSAGYRGKPFWSWNGKLRREELLRQVDVMKKMGFGGYFMHSRTGLVTEYLGDEWFDLVNAVADKGAEVGMENWLYDEDRWPSGTAGGFVTMNPEFSMRYIRMTMDEGGKFEFQPEYFIVFSCDMLPSHRFAFTNDREITSQTPREEYADKTVVAFSVELMKKSSFYNGYTYVDTMNPSAIQKYIELTHDKYAAKCGARMGTTISGIFTDEPHRGAVMCGFSTDNKGADFLTPYTPALFDEFRKKYGYDLKRRLTDLFMLRDGEEMSQVKYHYMNLIEELFLKAFAMPINNWCNDHGIKLTGHVLHEDTLTTQACMIGSIMRFYEYMGVPGVDVLTEGNRGYWIVKQLASVARQMGQKQLISELYGCTGWQMDFESHKWTGGWQALFGINMRCHHLSWYSMQGEAKRDYPASILHQSAWYTDYGVVEDYFSRLNVVLGGSPVCDTLVLNPVESVFAMIYPQWSISLGTNHPTVGRLESMYFRQFHWLAESQIDFDYGDEEMMSRHCSVVIEDGVPFIKFGKMKYKTVIISGMMTIRATTVALLDEFTKLGGTVIVAGFAPDRVDAVKSDAFDKISAPFTKVPFEKEALVGALTAKSPRTVVVTDSFGAEMPDIFCQLRHSEDGWFAVLMNMSKETSYYNCKIKISLDGDCEEWFPADGSKAFIASSENGVIEITADIYAVGEHVYRVCEKSELAPLPVYTEAYSYPLGETFDIELSEPNVLVLDMVKFEIDGVKHDEYTEILKADMQIRDAYGLAHRGGSMVQPWFLGLQEQKKHGKIALEYEFFAEYIPEKFDFVCETPELWKIYINGKSIDSSSCEGVWIDEAFHRFACDSSLLKQGRNTVRMEADFYETLNLEAVYITGDFCVRLNNFDKILTAPVRRMIHGDIAKNGLPFYSGAITYKTKINYNAAQGGRVFVTLPDFEAALVKVSANDGEFKPIAWQPYEADITDMLKDGENTLSLQYVLTRRNTFGPLHATPARWGAYGPGNFLTGGEQWTDNYVFVPAGMTAVPRIVVKK